MSAPNNSLQATTPAAFTSFSLRSPSVRLAGVAPELNAVRRWRGELVKKYWVDELGDVSVKWSLALIAAALVCPFLLTVVAFGVLKVAATISPGVDASVGSFAALCMLPGLLAGPLALWASEVKWSGIAAIVYGVLLLPVLAMYSLLLTCALFQLCL